MQEFEGQKKSGMFCVAGHGEILGHLTLQGADTTLELTSNEFFEAPANGDQIHGTLHDRMKVSLIKCVATDTGGGSRYDERYYSVAVFPHFAIFGDAHLSKEDKVITSVYFTVDDVTALFNDRTAFGLVNNVTPELVKAIRNGLTREERRDAEFG